MTLEEQVLALLSGENRPFSTHEIAQRTEGSYGYLRKVLSRMARENRITRLSDGVYQGRGSQPVPSQGQNDGGHGEPPASAEIPPPLRQKLEVADEIIHIPEVQIEPDAGAGTDTAGYDLEEVNGELRLPAWYIRAEYGVEPSRVRQIRTRGNSMQPTIYPGQRLLVALWEGEPLQDGLVYVIYGPHGLMIKRLFLREDEEGRRWVVVSSDNRKRVEPFRVPAERFEQDYRIVAVALEINRKL